MNAPDNLPSLSSERSIDYRNEIENSLKDGAILKLDVSSLIPSMQSAVNNIINSYRSGGKVIICGNGGSSSQADHFAAELVGRFEKEGRALPCISLTNPAMLTAIGNDYGFENVFSRQVEAYANKGDVLIILTTSDFNEQNKHSLNIRNAVTKAKEKGVKTVGLLSVKSEKIGSLVDIPIKVRSKNTARIQEMHIALLHLIAQLVEKKLR